MTHNCGHMSAPHLSAKEKLGKHKHCDSKIDAATQQNVKGTSCWRLVKDSIGGRVLLSVAGNIPAQLATEAKVTAAKPRKETIVTGGETLLFETACDSSESIQITIVSFMTHKSGHMCAPHLSAREQIGKHKHCDSKIDAVTQHNEKRKHVRLCGKML